MKSHPIYRRRLLMLAHLLRSVYRRGYGFEMSTWGDDEFIEHGCGTSACMLGWATTVPAFHAKTGITLIKSGMEGLIPRDLSGNRGTVVGEALFGLSGNEAKFFFCSKEEWENVHYEAENDHLWILHLLHDDSSAGEAASNITKWVREQETNNGWTPVRLTAADRKAALAGLK